MRQRYQFLTISSVIFPKCESVISTVTEAFKICGAINLFIAASSSMDEKEMISSVISVLFAPFYDEFMIEPYKYAYICSNFR